VTVHGRTAQQLYHGQSDKALIARVKEAVSIPVIASGDVFTCADIQSYCKDYGADAVMVARGARGNPWIFSAREAPEGVVQQPTLEERVRVAHEHAQGLAALIPQRLPSMHRHLSWYFKGTPHASSIRRAVHSCVTLLDYEALFEQILAWR
jgi:tRNA-dihydrouridine synthase